jgi:hypothetical protein
MFRPSPAIVASVQRARNPQAEAERLALGRRDAAQRRLAMEGKVGMPQPPESSLPSLMVPWLGLPPMGSPPLALALLELPWLASPLLVLALLPVQLSPACRVPPLTHRAGPILTGRWKVTTDSQNVKESDPGTRRSPWWTHARPTLRRP